MKIGFGIATAILAFALTTVAPPAQACKPDKPCYDSPGQQNKHASGAPGPIAGAGLPILAVGYGVYWLIRRRRKPTDI